MTYTLPIPCTKNGVAKTGYWLVELFQQMSSVVSSATIAIRMRQ